MGFCIRVYGAPGDGSEFVDVFHQHIVGIQNTIVIVGYSRVVWCGWSNRYIIFYEPGFDVHICSPK